MPMPMPITLENFLFLLQIFEGFRIGGDRTEGFGQGYLFPLANSVLQRKGAPRGACYGFCLDWMRRILTPQLLPPGFGDDRQISAFSKPGKFESRLEKVARVQELLNTEQPITAVIGFIANRGHTLGLINQGLPRRGDAQAILDHFLRAFPPDARQFLAQAARTYAVDHRSHSIPLPSSERLSFLWKEGLKKSIVVSDNTTVDRHRRHTYERINLHNPEVFRDSIPFNAQTLWQSFYGRLVRDLCKGEGGLLFLAPASGPGHVVAHYRGQCDRLFYFDPNFGEYIFYEKDYGEFVGAAWSGPYNPGYCIVASVKVSRQ